MKRISKGHFDDVQKVNKLPSKAPREIKELVKHHKLLYPTVFLINFIYWFVLCVLVGI
ncbi:hypothetical protein Hanom_Chr11g00990011 [Helianthus anomalus]